MPRRKPTRNAVSDATPPPVDERRREIERILKLSPGELDPGKRARRQKLRDAEISRLVDESLRAAGIDTSAIMEGRRKQEG